MKVEVVPHSSLWARHFAAERSVIEGALGDVVLATHHIGSTSVEGLSAKPIIDIIVEVISLEVLDQNVAKLEALGYEGMGEFGITGRRFFRKGGLNRTHHVHAFKSGDAHIDRHLAFRDYLNHSVAVRGEYGELKARLALEFPCDPEGYSDGKDAFIRLHEAKAIEWKRTTGGG